MYNHLVDIFSKMQTTARAGDIILRKMKIKVIVILSFFHVIFEKCIFNLIAYHNIASLYFYCIKIIYVKAVGV